MSGSALAAIRGGIIVSCQAIPDDPFDSPEAIAEFARAAAVGGAVGLRVNGPVNVAACHAAAALPIVGIHKLPDQQGKTIITPSLAAAAALVEHGAAMVAIEVKDRDRPDGATAEEVARGIRENLQVPVLGDIGSLEEGIAAARWCDAVVTTFAPATGRYSDNGTEPMGGFGDSWAPPALALVAELSAAVEVPVIAEGRFWQPYEVSAAFAAGAHAVVIGTAITRPHYITARFVAAAARP